MRSISIALTLLLPAAALAQERGRVRGFVRSASGEAWADAQVVLHGRPLHGLEGFGEAECVRATTDERGRFSAGVLRGRSYLVWAWRKREGEVYRSTPARICAVGGAAITLAERPIDLIAPSIDLDVAAAWPRPLRVFLTSAQDSHSILRGATPRSGVATVLRLGEGGPAGVSRVRIPRVPWPDCAIEVFDARGVQLAVFGIDLDAKVRRRRVGRAAPRYRGVAKARVVSLRESVCSVPEPGREKLTVREGGMDGPPVAKAKIVQRVRGVKLVLATADQSGVAILELPSRLPAARFTYPFGLRSADYVVQAPGYAEADARDFRTVARPLEKPVARERVVVLKRGVVMTGRVVVGETPIRDADLLFEITRDRSSGTGESAHVRFERSKSDHSGAFRIEHVNTGGQPFRVYCVLDEVSIAACTRGGDRPHPIAQLCAGKTSDENAELGTIDVRKLRRLTIAVRNPDGSRAADAELGHVVRVEPRESNPARPLVLWQPPLNKRGEATLLGAAFDGIIAAAVTRDAWGHAFLGEVREDAERVVIGLAAPDVASGVITDGTGEPIRDVVVEAMSLRGRTPHARAATFVDRFLAKTDAKGRFQLWLLKKAPRWRLVMARVEKGRIAGHEVVEIATGNGSARELELTMQR